jgi:two-component system, NtrC family, response regulator PilR
VATNELCWPNMQGSGGVPTSHVGPDVWGSDQMAEPLCSDTRRGKVTRQFDPTSPMSQPLPTPQGGESSSSRGEGHGPAPYSEFLAELARVASSDVTVLLEGEPGTGKSFAAASLHSQGPRQAAPFLPVSLGALAPTLLEAELFGHESGAFTGADRARPGRFRQAEGGTIVLEGIEALPLDLQVKLLRVLQERVVEPLGATEAVPVDVRVIATSAKDLSAEVAAGTFREDLYWRLAVVVLRVPPLRARIGELHDLTAILMERVATRSGVTPCTLSPEALARLEAHAWPGNVRELENALERVCALRPGDDHGDVQAEEFAFLNEAVAGASDALARAALAQGVGIEDLSSAMIRAALDESRGNASAAARRLGLTRKAFDYRKRRMDEAAAQEESEESE